MDSNSDHPDQKAKKLPRTAEYYEAVQAEARQQTEEQLKKFSPEEREGFRLIEEFTAEMEKRKLPFALWIAPQGIESLEKDTGGFYRWFNLSANEPPYSEKSFKNIITCSVRLFGNICNVFTLSLAHLKVVTFLNDRPWFLSKQGEILIPPQEDENENN